MPKNKKRNTPHRGGSGGGGGGSGAAAATAGKGYPRHRRPGAGRVGRAPNLGRVGVVVPSCLQTFASLARVVWLGNYSSQRALGAVPRAIWIGRANHTYGTGR